MGDVERDGGAPLSSTTLPGRSSRKLTTVLISAR
jgi:hypothetical protein